MLGTIAGDAIGSVYEGARIKHADFPLFSSWSTFTNDTVLTIATAHGAGRLVHGE
jgi:ADP-ribosylglycohydrolase